MNILYIFCFVHNVHIIYNDYKKYSYSAALIIVSILIINLIVFLCDFYTI